MNERVWYVPVKYKSAKSSAVTTYPVRNETGLIPAYSSYAALRSDYPKKGPNYKGEVYPRQIKRLTKRHIEITTAA